jgi:Pyruvate/2-oxoacid:ferredoxin oxidoreductase delta subunit
MSSIMITKREAEVYEELRKAMNLALYPAPRSPSVTKLLKFYFPTMEDAEIGKYLECAWTGGKAKTAKEISEESGKNLEEVKKILDRLVKRGVIELERVGEPGVIEYSHIGSLGMSDWLGEVGKDDSIDPAGTTYREVVNQYYDEGYLMEWGWSKYPFFRTVIVDRPIDTEAKVLPYELASGLIKGNEKIAIGYCNCRIRERKCNHRIDCCILLGVSADIVVRMSKNIPGARPVKYASEEEALKVLYECFEEGLVASTMNNANPEQCGVICMCCTCCCHVLGGYAKNLTGWGNPYVTMKSNFAPRVDEAKCNKCGRCIDLCPVNARWRHWPHKPDLSDDFIFFEEDRCLGCGICALNCPKEALTMIRVRDFTPEPDMACQFQRMNKERRH